MPEKIMHYYKTGEFGKLERALDAQSQDGWQVTKAGRLLQRFEKNDAERYCHRIGYCAAKCGTAAYTAYTQAAQQAGWQPISEERGWILFRKSADSVQPDEQLPDGRQPIEALYAARTKRCEVLRRWMLILGAALLIGGYVIDKVYVIYSAAAPMLVALLATYRVKFMQEGLNS